MRASLVWQQKAFGCGWQSWDEFCLECLACREQSQDALNKEIRSEYKVTKEDSLKPEGGTELGSYCCWRTAGAELRPASSGVTGGVTSSSISKCEMRWKPSAELLDRSFQQDTLSSQRFSCLTKEATFECLNKRLRTSLANSAVGKKMKVSPESVHLMCLEYSVRS